MLAETGCAWALQRCLTVNRLLETPREADQMPQRALAVQPDLEVFNGSAVEPDSTTALQLSCVLLLSLFANQACACQLQHQSSIKQAGTDAKQPTQQAHTQHSARTNYSKCMWPRHKPRKSKQRRTYAILQSPQCLISLSSNKYITGLAGVLNLPCSHTGLLL
jgi:hypothetical protein